MDGIPNIPLTWDSCLAVQQKNEVYKSVENSLTRHMDTKRRTYNKPCGRDRVYVQPKTKLLIASSKLITTNIQKNHTTKTKLFISTHPTSKRFSVNTS